MHKIVSFFYFKYEFYKYFIQLQFLKIMINHIIFP